MTAMRSGQTMDDCERSVNFNCQVNMYQLSCSLIMRDAFNWHLQMLYLHIDWCIVQKCIMRKSHKWHNYGWRSMCIHVSYCDGGPFSGNRSDPVTVIGTPTLFHGRRILITVLSLTIFCKWVSKTLKKLSSLVYRPGVWQSCFMLTPP